VEDPRHKQAKHTRYDRDQNQELNQGEARTAEWDVAGIIATHLKILSYFAQLVFNNPANIDDYRETTSRLSTLYSWNFEAVAIGGQLKSGLLDGLVHSSVRHLEFAQSAR
jgi:hypothetical protein